MAYGDFGNGNMLQGQIDALYSKIKTLRCNDTNAILRTTSEVEKLSSQNRNNTELLILMTRMQIFNSQEQRARAIANRVWQLGGNIRPQYEKMYLRDLINLGLVDMATVLLRPRFADLATNAKMFPLEMINYALMTGNAPLLKKISLTRTDNRLFAAMKQFADTYEYNRYDTHFANIQKIVLENVGNMICGYDFNYFTDRGFTDVEIVLYFSNYDFNINQYKMLINNKIDGYFLTTGAKRICNLNFVFRKIKDCPTL